MNDRFKFKGQTKKGKWIYGSLLWYADEPQIWDKEGNNFIVKSETVGQCTGLRDKVGKLIYEGDILLSLATKSHIGVVCWDKEKAYFKINGKGIAYHALQTFCSKNAFEVIGNIYENPELLEEQCANQLNKG